MLKTDKENFDKKQLILMKLDQKASFYSAAKSESKNPLSKLKNDHICVTVTLLQFASGVCLHFII